MSIKNIFSGDNRLCVQSGKTRIMTGDPVSTHNPRYNPLSPGLSSNPHQFLTIRAPTVIGGPGFIPEDGSFLKKCQKRLFWLRSTESRTLPGDHLLTIIVPLMAALSAQWYV